MTLRDLTKRQLYNVRRRVEKERKAAMKSHPMWTLTECWNAAYNAGFKAALELLSHNGLPK